jgi:hypothetical protein
MAARTLLPSLVAVPNRFTLPISGGPMSEAERLDRAIDDVLVGARPAVDPQLRPLVEVATRLRVALTPPPVAPSFEARLSARLRPAVIGRGRLVATGAVGSAAIGLAGVTAYAVWRVAHR